MKNTPLFKSIALALGVCIVAPLTLTACNEDNNGTTLNFGETNYETLLTNFKDKIDKEKNGILVETKVITTAKDINDKDVTINQGGYGSDAFVNPANPTQFYALTDRGPNLDVDGIASVGKGKAFPTPDYVPKIGLFQMTKDGKISLVRAIELQKPQCKGKTTGLPNPANGATNEIAYTKNPNGKDYDTLLLADPTKPYDAVNNPTKTDAYGIDPEGLAVMKDGTFWVSDEYGPHIVHYDANGCELARINAYATGDGASTYKVNGNLVTLPAEFKKRRANRGMEGLTVTPDNKYLVGIMQSPMENPSKKDMKGSTLTRIVRIELATGKIEQYIYRQENTSSDSNSGIVAIDKDNYYVIERDGEMPSANAAAVKKVYKINLQNATDLEKVVANATLVQDEKLGLTLGGKTLEQTAVSADGWKILETNGIFPVSKTEYLDAVMKLHYPHDKLEGLLLFPNGTLGLLNDDDFGITNNLVNGVDYIKAKTIDTANTVIDNDRLYLYKQ